MEVFQHEEVDTKSEFSSFELQTSRSVTFALPGSCEIIENRKLKYKLLTNRCRLFIKILEENGFTEVEENNEFWNVLWSGKRINLEVYQSLNQFQKV